MSKEVPGKGDINPSPFPLVCVPSLCFPLSLSQSNWFYVSFPQNRRVAGLPGSVWEECGLRRAVFPQTARICSPRSCKEITLPLGITPAGYVSGRLPLCQSPSFLGNSWGMNPKGRCRLWGPVSWEGEGRRPGSVVVSLSGMATVRQPRSLVQL